jgi:hypothetical protein
LYYSDTDSIFLDIALPNDLVGNAIGQMKDELIKKETKLKIYFSAHWEQLRSGADFIYFI